jgi:hypothetical protein
MTPRLGDSMTPLEHLLLDELRCFLEVERSDTELAKQMHANTYRRYLTREWFQWLNSGGSYVYLKELEEAMRDEPPFSTT